MIAENSANAFVSFSLKVDQRKMIHSKIILAVNDENNIAYSLTRYEIF